MTRVTDWEEDGMEEGDVREEAIEEEAIEEEVVDHLNDHMNEYEGEDEGEDEDYGEDYDDGYDDYGDDDEEDEYEDEYDENLDEFLRLNGMSKDTIVYMDPELDITKIQHYSYKYIQGTVKHIHGRRDNMTKMKIASYQTTDSPEKWGGSRYLVFLDLANQDGEYFPGCWWPLDWIIRNPEFLRTRAKTQTRIM